MRTPKRRNSGDGPDSHRKQPISSASQNLTCPSKNKCIPTYTSVGGHSQWIYKIYGVAYIICKKNLYDFFFLDYFY